MSRLIDADALIGELHTQFLYDGRDRTRIYAKIQEQPTIDAVEVVRCGECKYWRNKDPEQIPTASIMCGHMHPDDFCSYGEREGE